MAISWINAEDLDNPTSPDAQDAAEAASWILYKLTAEKYPGVRTSTQWYGWDVSTCHPNLRSLVGSFFELRPEVPRLLRTRNQPIRDVQMILEGDIELSPTDFMIVNGAYVVKADKSSWNYQEGITITYSHGTRPPSAGARAAKRLGNELVLAAAGDSDCALPERITSVSRQGIDYAILDPGDFIEEGRTGLHEVDLFIHAANPYRAQKRPKVFSPDIPSGRNYR